MDNNRPRVFLDVSIDAQPAGRLVIELFTDQTPKTCENFRTLCNGTHENLTYALSPFHRVIDEFMIQGGDITKGDGTGGVSIYGEEFADENLSWREMDAAGLVCMANRGRDTNSSQFFITLEPCPHLNNKHTIFGHLVSGTDVLSQIAKEPVDRTDRPKRSILISRSGELERRSRGRRPDEAKPPRTRDKPDETFRGRPSTRSSDDDGGGSSSSSPRAKRGHSPDRVSPPPRKHQRVRSASPSRGSRHEGEVLRRSRSRSVGRHEERRRRRDGDREPRGDEDRGQRRGEEDRWRRDGDRAPRWRDDEWRSRGGGRDHGRNYDRGGGRDRYRQRDSYRNRDDGRLRDEGRLNDDRDGAPASEDGIKFKGRGSMKYREPERRW
ncbi:hypothetical protein ANO11243_063220 [Dothideomycetidae sp. 11243]|nr:hypothetical protein ANO11243_063220 [fungal sp. No.11243]